jgi:hypothetical protein
LLGVLREDARHAAQAAALKPERAR